MKKNIVYIIAAIVAIVVAGFFGMKLITTQEAAIEAAKPVETPVAVKEIVVAARDINAGELIGSDALTTTTVEVNDPKAWGAYESFSQAVGKRSMMSITKGQPLYESMMKGSVEKKEELAYRVPEGMVALPIDTDALNGVEGYLKAGDTVDILCSAEALASAVDYDAYINAMKKGDSATVREIIYLAQNVTVLEVGDIFYSESAIIADQPIQSDEAAETAAPTTNYYDCVILCVDEELARTIVQIREADGEHKLTLTLRHRNYEDVSEVEAPVRDIPEDFTFHTNGGSTNTVGSNNPSGNNNSSGNNNGNNAADTGAPNVPDTELGYEGISDVIGG